MGIIPPRSRNHRSDNTRRSDNARQTQVQEKRILGLGGLSLLVGLGLAARLVYIQHVRHEYFDAQSLPARPKQLVRNTERGRIFDRDHNLLVADMPCYDIVLDPNVWFVKDPADKSRLTPVERRALALEMLRPIYGDLSARVPVYDRAPDAGKRHKTVELEHFAEPSRRDAIRARELPTLPMGYTGIGFHEKYHRRAVGGSLASNAIGFLDADGKAHGGIERAYDPILRGIPEIVLQERDARGNIPGSEYPKPGALPPRPGFDLYTTLDSTLQHLALQELTEACGKKGAQSGSIVVLDAKTGDVLAYVSIPTFDVNAPGSGQNGEHMDRAARAVFEPGSTLKAITFAAALNDKKTSLDEGFYCAGKSKVGKHTIHCALHKPYEHGHGSQSLIGSFAQSCNVVTAACGFRLGKERLLEYERAFGFGRPTGVGIAGERAGVLPSMAKFSDIRLANVSFGQGISVTPIQLAAAYTVFVDGKYRAPRLVSARRDPRTGEMLSEPRGEARQVIRPEVAEQMRTLLKAVMETGTGKVARLTGYTSGGKTGTAQIANGSKGYGREFVAAFVGLAPLTDPEVVVLVSIQAPQGGDYYGGSVAGPIFKRITEKALQLRRTPRDQWEPSPKPGKSSR